MQKTIGLMLMLAGLASLGFAATLAAPEISPESAGSAIALASGVVLVFRGRRRK
jgi:hypothetical protein